MSEPPPPPSYCDPALLRKLFLTACMAIALALTYDHCVACVAGIAIASALTMNCITGMNVVFLLAVLVLLMHAIDYQRASIRVEVPIQDVIYVPTWDDVKRYVHVSPGPTPAPQP